MKSLILLIMMLCFIQLMNAQNIRKVKIEDLAEYISKSDHPLIVNFWATWCSPCIHELTYFQTGVKKYAAKKAELVLVSLDFRDDYPGKIAAFIRKQNYQGSFFWLDETDADHFCPLIDQKWEGAIPATLFINNKTGHRAFFDRQLTEPQFNIAIKSLVN